MRVTIKRVAVCLVIQDSRQFTISFTPRFSAVIPGYPKLEILSF
jgi:hypothetical protein